MSVFLFFLLTGFQYLWAIKCPDQFITVRSKVMGGH